MIVTAFSSLRVRELKPGEAAEAAALAGRCEGAAQWPTGEYARIASPGRPGEFCLVVERPDGGLAGLLVARVLAGESEILNLAVGAEHRRLGLGSHLLAAALGRGKAMGAKQVWLEVRESNEAAIAFYHRHGFVLSGRRPGYYDSPCEAALILTKPLGLPQ